MKLNKFRHYFLYAKGHYKVGNRIEDLQKIQCDYVGCDTGVFISPDDIVRVLSRAVDSLKEPMTCEKFSELLIGYSRQYVGGFQWKNVESPLDMLIETQLGILRHASNTQISASGEGDLGDPDYSILEKYDSTVNRRVVVKDE